MRWRLQSAPVAFQKEEEEGEKDKKANVIPRYFGLMDPVQQEFLTAQLLAHSSQRPAAREPTRSKAARRGR